MQTEEGANRRRAKKKRKKKKEKTRTEIDDASVIRALNNGSWKEGLLNRGALAGEGSTLGGHGGEKLGDGGMQASEPRGNKRSNEGRRGERGVGF
jgi:hypothetical protein